MPDLPDLPDQPDQPDQPDPTPRRARPGRRPALGRPALPTPDLAALRRRLDPRGRGRPDVLTTLAVGLPLLTLVAGLLVHPHGVDGLGPQAPLDAPLVRTSVVCPASPGGRLLVATDAELPGGRGTVAVRSAGVGARSAPLTIRRTVVAQRSAGQRAGVVVGEDAAASALSVLGLLGGRLAAGACAVPSADQWFTGLGADATHRSILELTNPDAGRAIVTLEALGTAGPIDAPLLRGLAVPGRRTVRIDLAQQLPVRGGLALHVTTDRGRVAASVLDRVVPLGRGTIVRETLPAQQRPTRTVALLGLPARASERTLSLANPGDDAVRVRLQVVGPESTFTPSKAREIVLDPRSARSVGVDTVLAGGAAADAVGLVVTGTAPVTATLRARVDGDLVEVAPGDALDATTVLPLPAGRSEVVLADAAATGEARIRAWDARGRQVLARAVDLVPGRAATLSLPASSRLVAVEPQRTSVAGAIVATASGRTGGAVVLPLRELARRSLQPAVRPGLP